MKTIKMLVMAMVVVFGFVVNALAFTEVVAMNNNIYVFKAIDEMTDEIQYFVTIESTKNNARIILMKDKSFMLQSLDAPLNIDFTDYYITITTMFRFGNTEAFPVNLYGDYEDFDEWYMFSAMPELANPLISFFTDTNIKKLLIKTEVFVNGDIIFEFNLDGIKSLYKLMVELNNKLSEG